MWCRGVVRATGANITGLTINEHQVPPLVGRAPHPSSALPPHWRHVDHSALCIPHLPCPIQIARAQEITRGLTPWMQVTPPPILPACPTLPFFYTS